jgi:hypothetical protein
MGITGTNSLARKCFGQSREGSKAEWKGMAQDAANSIQFATRLPI